MCIDHHKTMGGEHFCIEIKRKWNMKCRNFIKPYPDYSCCIANMSDCEFEDPFIEIFWRISFSGNFNNCKLIAYINFFPFCHEKGYRFSVFDVWWYFSWVPQRFLIFQDLNFYKGWSWNLEYYCLYFWDIRNKTVNYQAYEYL